jgi:hypothetical protein
LLVSAFSVIKKKTKNMPVLIHLQQIKSQMLTVFVLKIKKKRVCCFLMEDIPLC